VGLLGEQVLIFYAGAAAFGLVGARLNDWLFRFEAYSASPYLDLASPHGGMASFGGVIGALAFGVFYARWQGWCVWVLLDLLAPVILLVTGVMRWGCLLNGCCYGRETDCLLGIYLPDLGGRWAARYPTQVMLSVLCLALFVWLWRRRRDRSFDGELILSYLAAYHLGRFAVDALRGDQRAVAGPLTAHQLTAITIAVIASVILLHRARRSAARV
jgi:phosphatidylglycerol:prolipoprotein diacylglycerol transferase